MQCEKFERRLHQVLDDRGRPEDDPLLRRHAECCPGCRSLLAAQQTLWAGLAELAVPQPRGDFAAVAVREAIRASSSSEINPAASTSRSAAHPSFAVSRRRKRTVFWWTMALALLLIAPLAYQSLPQKGTPHVPKNNFVQDDSVQQERAPQPLEASPQIAEMSLSPEHYPVAAADSTLREEQYAELLDRWRVQIAQTSGRLGLTDADAPTIQGAAAVSQLTHRLRMPLAASIESTLNVLRSALPSSTAEKSRAKPQAHLSDVRADGLV